MLRVKTLLIRCRTSTHRRRGTLSLRGGKKIELLYAELALGRPQLSRNFVVRCPGHYPALQIFISHGMAIGGTGKMASQENRNGDHLVCNFKLIFFLLKIVSKCTKTQQVDAKKASDFRSCDFRL